MFEGLVGAQIYEDDNASSFKLWLIGRLRGEEAGKVCGFESKWIHGWEEDKSKNKFNSHCRSLLREKEIDFEEVIVETEKRENISQQHKLFSC